MNDTRPDALVADGGAPAASPEPPPRRSSEQADTPAPTDALASSGAPGRPSVPTVSEPPTEPAVEVADSATDPAAFTVRLRNFEGPFDLLLQLISQHRLDVTEVALHTVTDEFIAFTRELGAKLSLDQTTEFLLVAATLLDLKAARLLPAGDVEDPEDLALLEARDLLFARLLQYRAFKQVAELFRELEAAALRRYPRSVTLEDEYADLLPEVVLGVDARGLAEVAAAAFRPKPVPTVGLDHLHDVQSVSVPEQAEHVLALLRGRGSGQWVSFSELVADCDTGLTIVGRFLALLELYRGRAVAFEQPEALGELQVSWTGEGGHVLTIEEDYG